LEGQLFTHLDYDVNWGGFIRKLIYLLRKWMGTLMKLIERMFTDFYKNVLPSLEGQLFIHLDYDVNWGGFIRKLIYLLRKWMGTLMTRIEQIFELQ
jgi:hypothetical protein